MTKQDIITFFEGIEARETEMKGLREDIKEAFSAFANSHETDVNALKDGYSFYKAMQKNRHEAETKEFLKDKIVEILLKEQADGE